MSVSQPRRVMDCMCASGVNLLPEGSGLCQMNNATNKVNMIPSHYPPPGISMSEGGTYGSEFVQLSCRQPFPVTSDMEENLPPPLPPREPTACGGVASSHRTVPVPFCIETADRSQDQTMIQCSDGADKVLNHECNNGFESMVANNSSDCLHCAPRGDTRHPILLNPVVHHRSALKRSDADDITHHCWNVLQAHSMTSSLSIDKDPSSVCVATDDRQSDASTKTPSDVQSTVLNQVIPLSRWPIGSRQPETHFVLDRVVARPPTGNEYVDSPLHVKNKDLPISIGSKRANAAVSVRLDSSLQDCSTVVTTQPTLSGNGKSKDTDENAGKSDKEALSPRHPPCKEGLICSRCGKCRCMSCTQSRQMPRCWIGPSFYRCECSAQQVVNVCSCLCCVQTLFYHCLYHPDDEHDIVMEPCACCESSRCCLRWTILGLLVPFLPCLCLYCPLQCGVDACTSCYNGCNQRGCHCGYNVSSSGSSTTRDLLLDSEPSST